MADTAVALFDWKADKPEAIDLKRGQVITLSDKSGNWWKGTVDGKTGKFPSNFVSLTKDAIKSVATFNYEKADDPTHLKFKKGDSIEVFKKDNTGWWVGRTANGAVGTFPANHVQEGAGVKKPKDEGSSRSSSSRSRSPSSRSNSASRSASGSQSRSRSPSSRSGSSRSRSSSRSPSDRSVSSRSGSSRSGSSRSRSGSASRSVSSRSASSAGDKKAAPAKAAAAAPVKEEPKAAPAKAAPAAPAAIEAKARSAPAEEAAVKPAAAAAAAPASAVIAKPAPAPAPAAEVKKEEPKKEEAKPAPAKPAPAKPANDSASDRSESSASRKSNSSKSKSSKSKSSQSKSNSDKSASEKSVSKSSSAKENKKAAAAPAPAPAKAAAAAPAEEKKVEEKKEPPKVEAKPAPAPAAKPAAPKEAPKASDKKSESSRSHSPSDRSRSPSPSDRSRSPSPSSRSSPRRRSESPSPKKTSGKHKERIETSARHRDDGSRSDRSGSGSERSSFVEGFHPAIKIPDAQDKDDLRVLLMINESQDAVKVRHALEGIQDIIHLDKSGLIAKKSGAIVALSKKVQSLISGGRPKVVKKDLDTCLDLLHQLVLDDFLAANDANDTGLINPLVALAASPEAAEDTKLRARKVLIALTAEENLKTCDSIVHSGHLLTLANQFAEGRDDARRDIGVILSRVLRVSGRMAQNALRQFHAFTGIVQALNSTDEHIQEAAAGVALWAVKDSGLCKNRFRIAHGLLPLARLLSSENAKVALQAAAATMELSAHNSENAKHFAKGTSAIPNLVTALRQHSLSHEGVVNVPLVHNVCGATWNIIRDRQYRVLAFLDEGIISPLIPLVERDNGPAHVLACKLQRKAPEMVQAHFYLSMEERWIKYQLAMQDYVRKHEAAVLADYRGEPIPMGVLDDQVKYDPYFTHHDHDPNVHRHAPRIPALHQFVAAGFNGPDVHVDPLVSGAPNGLRMHHTLAVPAASMPQQPPAFNGGAKISGIFMSKKVFKSAPSSANKPSRRIDVPAN